MGPALIRRPGLRDDSSRNLRKLITKVEGRGPVTGHLAIWLDCHPQVIINIFIKLITERKISGVIGAIVKESWPPAPWGEQGPNSCCDCFSLVANKAAVSGGGGRVSRLLWKSWQINCLLRPLQRQRNELEGRKEICCFLLKTTTPVCVCARVQTYACLWLNVCKWVRVNTCSCVEAHKMLLQQKRIVFDSL